MFSMIIAIGISASILRAKATLDESRFKPEYFTRNRKMPFEKLLKFMLSMNKTSTQNALNRFFEKEGITMSQQALSKARNKFNNTPFLKLYNAIREAYYSSEYIATLDKLHNKFIIAIDGSDTPLPNLPGLRDKFSGTGAKASSPTARMSIAYDVTNDFIMDADFSPLTVSERTHAKNHLEKVGNLIDLKEAIFIMARGYASEELIRLFSEKSNYLFRIRNKFNVEIDNLSLGSHILKIYNGLKVRIIKFTLPSGEIETLMTNLFELNESEFKELYFKRWPVEVKFDIVKNKLEMPCFGGFLLKKAEIHYLNIDSTTADRYCIEFLTPYRTKIHIDEFGFPQLIRAMLRRTSTILRQIGIEPDFNYKDLIEKSEKIETDYRFFNNESRTRYSSRSNTRWDVTGFTGIMIVSGDFSDFLPLIRISEIIGVGKLCVMGHGKIRISALI